MAPSLIELADDIAERVLFAAALQTDEADIVPRARLDVLAEAGLYGLAGPAKYGGAGVDIRTASGGQAPRARQYWPVNLASRPTRWAFGCVPAGARDHIAGTSTAVTI